MSDEQTKWLDAPSCNGLWWGNFGGATNCYLVNCGKAYLHGEDWLKATPLDEMPRGWWKRAEVPTDVPAPPPEPLPRSKQVDMRGRVVRALGAWQGLIDVGDTGLTWFTDAVAKDLAIEFVRNHGIEPEIVEAPAPEGEKR